MIAAVQQALTISGSHRAYLQLAPALLRALWVTMLRLQKPVLLGCMRCMTGSWFLLLTRAPKSLEFLNGNRRQAAFAQHNELLAVPGKSEGFGDRHAGG